MDFKIVENRFALHEIEWENHCKSHLCRIKLEQSRREEKEIWDSDEADQQKRAKEKREILKEKTEILLQELRDRSKIKEPKKNTLQSGISANLDDDAPKPKTAKTLICEWCYVKCEEFNELQEV